jgi:hypothetical protein
LSLGARNKKHLSLLTALFFAALPELDGAVTVAISDTRRSSARQGKASTTDGVIALERDSTTAKQFAPSPTLTP